MRNKARHQREIDFQERHYKSNGEKVFSMHILKMFTSLSELQGEGLHALSAVRISLSHIYELLKITQTKFS